MNCPACGNNGPFTETERHTDPFAGGAYSLRRCSACSLVFSDPMKNPGPDWYRTAAGPWTARLALDLKDNWRVIWLSELFPPSGARPSLVDIGCGDGFFMAGAKAAGFSPWGIDFDPDRTATAAELGLDNIFTGTLEAFAAAHPGLRFDVATAFQTLEHLEDPCGFLIEAGKLLRPGGLLLVDVPNSDRAFASTLALIDYPPHHLTRWTAAALAAALERSGFRIERSESVMQLGNFYDHVFSLFTLTLAALVKKARYGGKLSELRLTPMAKAAGTGTGGNGAALRARLVAAARVLYYALFWLPALPLAAAFTFYCRRAGKGMFIAVTARKAAP